LRWLILTLLLLLVLAGVAGVVELVLQVRAARDVDREVRRHPPHPFLQVLPGYAVAVNPSGFRGRPIQTQKPAGAFRIIALGGSTTLGVANREDETYPYYLGALLRARYPDSVIEVENAGGAWYSTAHILVNYELRVRPYEPDLVVVFEAINDLYRSFSPPWFAVGPFRPDYSHYIGPYSRFLGPEVDDVAPSLRPLGSDWLLWRTLARAFGGDPSPFDYHPTNVAKITATLREREVRDFKSLPSFHRYYERLVRNILADGHRVVIGSQPFLYRPDLPPEERALIRYPQIFCAENGTYPTLASMEAGMRRFNAEAHAVADAAHVPFLDFEAAVPKTDRYFSDDVHLTAAGNQILAKMVFDGIVAAHLIDGGRPAPRATAKATSPRPGD
jgi:lysophospholipase L1-like esterase